jgi:hypothetical protein
MNNGIYTPDSIFMKCGATTVTDNCTECYNQITTNLYPGNVYATERAFAYCPFGKGESMNRDIFNEQKTLNISQDTTWGRVPQLSPRPLTRIGLEWKN